MAGSLIQMPLNGATNWEDFPDIVEKIQRGFDGLTWSNLENDSEPKIQAGSVIDVNGGLYQFTAEESITGWGAIGDNTTVYVKLVPAGSSITVEFTTTPPVWSDSKLGYYDSNDRYVMRLRRLGSAIYASKRVLRTRTYLPFGLDGIFRRFISEDAIDYNLTGATLEQRIIHARNFRVSVNTELRADVVVVEGDFVVDDSITLTIGILTGNQAAEDSNSAWGVHTCGSGGITYGTRGGGAWGGSAGQASGQARGGGGSIEREGGRGDETSGFTLRGIPYADSLGQIGGQGGDAAASGSAEAGGGGAGPGAGGGSGSLNNGGAGGSGADSILFIVRGNVLIGTGASIEADGGPGLVDNGQGGGGGAGGMVIFVCHGTWTNNGTIQCEGGDGGSSAHDGGGGGGGHIEIYAHTSTFGTLSVTGGTGPGAATDGQTGTTFTIDLDSDPESVLGGDPANATAGVMVAAMCAKVGIV